MITLQAEPFEEGLGADKVFEGFLEVVCIVAEGGDHLLNCRGDGGGVELEDAKPGGIESRLGPVVLRRNLRRLLCRLPFPFYFIRLPVGLPAPATSVVVGVAWAIGGAAGFGLGLP